jgi:hypothetical protein
MKVNEIIKRLKENFPEYIQESYDNTGSQILFNEDNIEKFISALMLIL